jgi:hypothetical protein
MSIMTTAGKVVTAAAVVSITSLTPAAQQPDRSAAPTAPAQMIIVGCLRSGPNPSGVPDTVTYTLEPIETAPAASKPGVAPDTGTPKSGTRYALTTTLSIELKAHVGHKVELTGHLKDLSRAASQTATRAPDTKPSQAGGAHNTFEVASLKMVASACP